VHYRALKREDAHMTEIIGLCSAVFARDKDQISGGSA